MEFHLLWCTKASEFTAWKKYLNAFPVRLLHHFHEELTPEERGLLCHKIALCISSERAFNNTTQQLREQWEKSKKPGLMIVDRPQFAIAAFRYGFSHCLKSDQLENQLRNTLIEGLSFYFHPNQKASFLQNKLWFPLDYDSDVLKFVFLNQIIQIHQLGKTCAVTTPTESIETPIPFAWLKIQCHVLTRHFLLLRDDLLLNLTYVKAIEPEGPATYRCIMNSIEDLFLSTKEYRKLKNHLKQGEPQYYD